MGFLHSLRRAFQGPVTVGGGGDYPGEIAADMHDEDTVPHPEDTDLEEVEETSPKGDWLGGEGTR
jgi:hypothetical protein